MSSTASGVHTLNIRDARIDVWDGQTCAGMIGIEGTSSSSSSSKPGCESSSSSSSSGTRVAATHDLGTDGPPTSPTRADATPTSCLPSSVDTSKKAAQRDLRRTRSPQLHSIYGLWSTCTCDVEDFRIPQPATRCFDGDIFGVGKRPVQHEVEADGCVRLVFVEGDQIVG